MICDAVALYAVIRDIKHRIESIKYGADCSWIVGRYIWHDYNSKNDTTDSFCQGSGECCLAKNAHNSMASLYFIGEAFSHVWKPIRKSRGESPESSQICSMGLVVFGIVSSRVKHSPVLTFPQADNRVQSCLLYNCRMMLPLGLCPLVLQALDKELRTRQQKVQQCAFCFLGVGRLGLFVVSWLVTVFFLVQLRRWQ